MNLSKKTSFILSILLISFQTLFSQTIDVGKTAGQLEVSLTGAATYNVPISVPPGIKDVVPQIGLSYSSQAGNGIAGWGWNISGLSSISRIPATTFHDGFIDPVDFDLDDRYALDGQRLILISGTYGVAGSVYTTENYSNIKVKAYGTHPDGAQYGPQYLRVFYPNGNTAVYGYYHNATGKLQWAISKWMDHQENVIWYHYYITNDVQRIDKIEYGGTVSTAAINRISFNYPSRNRPEQIYTGGISLTNTKILNTIEVETNNQLLREYQLAFNTTSLGYERLTQIQEFNGEGYKFKPIIFHYEDTTNDDLFQHSETIINSTYSMDIEDTGVVSGDFNEDGRMDMVTYNTDGSNKRKNFILYESLPNGSFSSGNTTVFGNSSSGFISLHYGKALLDNKITPVLIGIDQFLDYGVHYSYVIFKYSEGGFTEVSSSHITYYGDSDYRPKKIVVADFNGDSISDIIAMDSECCYNKIIYCEGISNGSFHRLHDIGDIIQPLQENGETLTDVQIGDYNGDGKSDLYIIRDNRIRVYSLNHDNTSLSLLYGFWEPGLKFNRPHLMGDFNGDGKTDFAQPLGSSSATSTMDWNFYFSKGDGFIKSWKPNFGFIDYTSIERNWLASDFNGDGKTDLCVVDTGEEQGGFIMNAHITFYESLTESPSHISFNTINSLQSLVLPGSTHNGIPVLLNHNNPNKSLEFGIIRHNKIHTFKNEKDHREDVLLRSVTNNYVTNLISYQNLEENSIYTPDYSQTYPYVNINIAPSLKLVSKIENYSNTYQNYKYKKFRYKGATSHIGGLGFKGFKITKRTNWHTANTPKIWSITQQYDDPYLRGAVKNQYTSLSVNNYEDDYISKTRYYYHSNTSPEGIFTVLPTTITQTDALQGITTTVTNTYDSYNNIDISTTTFDNSIGTKTVDYDYANNDVIGDWYFIGLPIRKTETNNIYDDVSSSTTEYQYQNFNIARIKKKANNSTWITENFLYDSFGNVTQKKLSATGITDRIENFEYDSSGRFLTSSTDIEGLTSTFDYNQTTGALLTKTNPFNQTTTYEYDGWGRPTNETDYLENQTTIALTTITLQNNNDYDAEGVMKTVTAADGSIIKSIYNPFGWLILKMSNSTIDGSWVEAETQYDALGRKELVSEPRFGHDQCGWTTYNYDDYGRLFQQTSPASLTVTTTFDGLSVTVNDNEKTITKTKDAAGNIIQSIDNGGTIDYTYYANGSMKTANYDGHIVSTSIDDWGRKIALNDPDAGTYTYTYNDIGELLEETTPKGATTYTYDAFGKMTNKTVVGDDTDMNINYTYDSESKLLSKISSGTYLQVFSYDSKKRLIQIMEQIINQGMRRFIKNNTYDNLGRINQNTLRTFDINSGMVTTVKTENHYNNVGMLYQIADVDTGQALWTLTEENARGQALEIALGNGINKTRTYSDRGFVSSMLDTGAGTTALNMQYSFEDERGRLLSRNNSQFNWNENFSYDSQQRLSQITGAVNFTQTYDNKGRIATNSNIGDYNYISESYKVRSINLNTTGYNYYEDHTHKP